MLMSCLGKNNYLLQHLKLQQLIRQMSQWNISLYYGQCFTLLISGWSPIKELHPKKNLFGYIKSKVGWLFLTLSVWVMIYLLLTGVPAKGAWSQFSCQERLRLRTNSWKKGWVLLKTEKPTMLTRWSATSSSRSKENSFRDKKDKINRWIVSAAHLDEAYVPPSTIVCLDYIKCFIKHVSR